MAPVQKLGNVDTKETDFTESGVRYIHTSQLSGCCYSFPYSRFYHYPGGKVISWDFLTEAPADGMTAGGIFPGDCRNTLSGIR